MDMITCRIENAFVEITKMQHQQELDQRLADIARVQQEDDEIGTNNRPEEIDLKDMSH